MKCRKIPFGLMAVICLAAMPTVALRAAPVVSLSHELVPYYTPAAYAQGLMNGYLHPRAIQFEQSTGQLEKTLRERCVASAATTSAAPPARSNTAIDQQQAAWRAAVSDWSAFQAVAIGPVVARRTQRRIDFQPSRVHLIEQALASHPVDLLALEQVGSAAKGFAALEWLLWEKSQALVAGTVTCHYAYLLAQDIHAESQALLTDVAALSAKPWTQIDEEASATMADTVNQWLGGIEALRWREMGKPLSSGKRALFARPYSGLGRVSWQAHWQSIRYLSVQAGPLPTGHSLIAMDTYLQGRGLIADAQALQIAVAHVDRAMAHLMAAAVPATAMQPVVTALGKLRSLVESRIAPALAVNIGFSDADGD